jgi:hypothetical protein
MRRFAPQRVHLIVCPSAVADACSFVPHEPHVTVTIAATPVPAPGPDADPSVVIADLAPGYLPGCRISPQQVSQAV